MTPTKLLIGQILVVFAIMILGVWAATQWAAAMLGYQSALGAPWARTEHYSPPSVLLVLLALHRTGSFSLEARGHVISRALRSIARNAQHSGFADAGLAGDIGKV